MGLRRLLGMRPRARRRATTDIDAMIADGDLDRAEGHLRAKILVHPNNLGNRVKLAALIARNKRPSMAAIEYMAIAEVHAADDAYDPAIRLVERALTLMPGNLDMTTRLVQLERLRQAASKRSVIFGEASLLDNAECPANYFAIGNNTTVLRMTRRALDGLLASELGAKDLVAAFRRLCSDGKVYALAHAPAEH